jgi:hypothetical protein
MDTTLYFHLNGEFHESVDYTLAVLRWTASWGCRQWIDGGSSSTLHTCNAHQLDVAVSAIR